MKLKCDAVIIQWMMRRGSPGTWVAKMGERAEKGQSMQSMQSMQSTSSHVRGESLAQADLRAEGAQG